MTKTNNFEIMGKAVDFKTVVPVYLMVVDYKAPIQGNNDLNVMGIVLQVKSGYTPLFRVRYPSGNKNIMRARKPYQRLTSAIKHLKKADDVMRSLAHCEAYKQTYVEIPIHARDPEGFTAFLRASDLFEFGVVPRAGAVKQ